MWPTGLEAPTITNFRRRKGGGEGDKKIEKALFLQTVFLRLIAAVTTSFLVSLVTQVGTTVKLNELYCRLKLLISSANAKENL